MKVMAAVWLSECGDRRKVKVSADLHVVAHVELGRGNPASSQILRSGNPAHDPHDVLGHRVGDGRSQVPGPESSGPIHEEEVAIFPQIVFVDDRQAPDRPPVGRSGQEHGIEEQVPAGIDRGVQARYQFNFNDVSHNQSFFFTSRFLRVIRIPRRGI
jgi:hypothetical protein